MVCGLKGCWWPHTAGRTSSAGYAAHRVVGGRILQGRIPSTGYAALMVVDGRILQGRIPSTGYAAQGVACGRILQGGHLVQGMQPKGLLVAAYLGGVGTNYNQKMRFYFVFVVRKNIQKINAGCIKFSLS